MTDKVEATTSPFQCGHCYERSSPLRWNKTRKQLECEACNPKEDDGS